MEVLVTYAGEQVSVPKEVSDFLESDHRKMVSLAKQDIRHLSKSDFETVLSRNNPNRHWLEDHAIRNLCLESLHKAVKELSNDDKKLIHLRFYEEWSMEEIGKMFGVSKMAISKRLKKLLAKLGNAVK